MNPGLAEEYIYRMLTPDREANAAWVTDMYRQSWVLPHRTWRQTVAAALVALADRVAPTVTTTSTRTQAIAR
jgi:hypothetical protein